VIAQGVAAHGIVLTVPEGDVTSMRTLAALPISGEMLTVRMTGGCVPLRTAGHELEKNPPIPKKNPAHLLPERLPSSSWLAVIPSHVYSTLLAQKAIDP
jgi:hypothetical protein